MRPLDDLVRYLEGQGAVDPGDPIQRLGLGDSARETVQDETVLAVILRDAILQQVDDQLIRDKLPSVHILLGFLSKRGVICNGLAENVAGGHGRHPHLFDEECRQSALTGARSAE